MMKSQQKTLKQRNPESYARHLAYVREYRKKHPEKCRKWRENAVISAYKRMIAQNDGEGAKNG